MNNRPSAAADVLIPVLSNQTCFELGRTNAGTPLRTPNLSSNAHHRFTDSVLTAAGLAIPDLAGWAFLRNAVNAFAGYFILDLSFGTPSSLAIAAAGSFVPESSG